MNSKVRQEKPGRVKANLTNPDKPCYIGLDTKETLQSFMDRFIKKYEANGCTAYKTCKQMYITYSTYQRLMENNEDFRARIEETNARRVEDVEVILWDLIQKGNLGAIMFFMKNKGGWTDKKEVTLNKGEDIDFVLNKME